MKRKNFFFKTSSLEPKTTRLRSESCNQVIQGKLAKTLNSNKQANRKRRFNIITNSQNSVVRGKEIKCQSLYFRFDNQLSNN
jgi:hypothetical protein